MVGLANTNNETDLRNTFLYAAHINVKINTDIASY